MNNVFYYPTKGNNIPEEKMIKKQLELEEWHTYWQKKRALISKTVGTEPGTGFTARIFRAG